MGTSGWPRCNHCGVVVQRGTENAPRAKCYNRNMQKHMGKYHDDLMEEVSKDQEAAKVVTRKVDVRCESVRGTIPIFNLRSQEDHSAFIKKVKIIGKVLFFVVLISTLR